MTSNHPSDTAESRPSIDRRHFLQGVGAGSALTLSGIASPAAAGDGDESASDEGVTWPTSQALPRFLEVKHLDVLDIRDLNREELFLTTLQGVVNRKRPRLYVLKDFEEGTFTWLDDLDADYTVHDTAANVDSVVEGYLEEVDTVVAYDPDVHASVNVATTIAGVDDGVVVGPERASELAEIHDHLTRRDLEGQFDGSQDAYRWLFDQYWDETSDRHLVGLPGGGEIPVKEVTPERQDYYDVLLQESERVRDASNRAEYEMDLTSYLGDSPVYVRFDDAFPDTGWGPGISNVRVETGAGDVVTEFEPNTAGEEPHLYHDYGTQTKEGFRFADRDAFVVYEFEPPADASELYAYVVVENQYEIAATSTQPPGPPETEFQPFAINRDYAVATRAFTMWPDGNITDLFETVLGEVETNGVYLGWFGGDFEGEASGVERCSRNSVYVSATDYFDNLTVFSGVNEDVGCRCDQDDDTPELENKVYVTLTYTEGDNLQYNQHRMRALWDDDARGEVPINWSTTPLLADAAPSILAHYQRTATENDHLTCGPSGLGYLYPTPWPDDTLDEFTEQTAQYMQRTDLDTIYMLNREGTENVPLDESTVDEYAENVDPKGVTLNFGGGVSAETDVLDGELARAAGPLVSDGNRLADVIESETPDDWSRDEPAFIAVGILAWNMMPSELVDGVSDLGSEYELVRSDQFFDLVWEAHEG